MSNDKVINREKQHKTREPLFQIVKRDAMPWYASLGVRLGAILLALIVCSAVLVLLTSMLGTPYNPVKIYKTMFEGAFGSERKTWVTLQDLAMLLCVSLAVTPAFKMKFWNIGAEGQTLIGGLCAAVCMRYLGEGLPMVVFIPVMTVACIASGALWGLIPAYFKARFNTNETLFTLMMNYVAMQIVKIFIAVWVPTGSGVLGRIKFGNMPIIFGKKQLLNILIVAVLTILMYVYLRFSKQGYEISVVGESENTAKYIGINVRAVIMRTMIISGAVCGIAGMLLVAGRDYTIAAATAGGMGFTAIMVSWLAKFNPLIMPFTSFLIVFLDRGASAIASDPALRLNESVSDVITGIILFFIIGCEFFVNYKVLLRRNNRKEV
ncbi:MAG: ABC transporter permease [Clostridia bacterium]|nr:ABC transporter permease [Clostridia bacterium]